MPDDVLTRTVFRTSREADFAGKKDLISQIGHSEADWPVVILKELVDNAADAAKEHGIAPEIAVTLSDNEIVVADNGPGIPTSLIEGILDFSVRGLEPRSLCQPVPGAAGQCFDDPRQGHALRLV
jgi:signal transduction histidine kinase